MPVVLQEGLVPFDIGVPISGDVAIGLWFGAYNLGQRLHSRPAAAYAFHTAFFEENKVTHSLPLIMTMHGSAWHLGPLAVQRRSTLCPLQAMAARTLIGRINSA